MISKQDLRSDSEVQLIKDTACLVSIEYYFADFAKDYSDDKIAAIVRKTWNRMSERGRAAARLIAPDIGADM